MAALQYLDVLRDSHSELSEWYTSLSDLYQRKLWHHLTLKLEQFVALTVFQAGDALIQLYHNFIKHVDHPISILLCFVSVIHLFVGVVYCLVSWTVGLPKRAPMDSNTLKLLIPVALCHALGHVTSNVSFAAVAVSFTHTIKALEPFFNASASQFILGQPIPLTLWLSLAPLFSVSMASLTELSFNWLGFISAMISNISFTYRSLYSKKAVVIF